MIWRYVPWVIKNNITLGMNILMDGPIITMGFPPKKRDHVDRLPRSKPSVSTHENGHEITVVF